MSANESTFPIQGYNIKNTPADKLLSLNEIFRESMRKAQARLDNQQVIVRCENLPSVKDNRHELVQLFDLLIGMILNNPPQNSKLFLYVDCEETNTDDLNGQGQEFKQFLIRFHTNMTTHDNWKVINSQDLIHCKQILSNLHGNLAVNNISSTGCLFTISLRGKIELDARY